MRQPGLEGMRYVVGFDIAASVTPAQGAQTAVEMSDGTLLQAAPGYGTYGVGTLARFLMALESAKISTQLYKHPFFATLPSHCISQMCPNDKQHTGFGDCWFSQPFPLCMTLLALRGNADAVWYVHEIDHVHAWSVEQLLTIGLHPQVFAEPSGGSTSSSRPPRAMPRKPASP